MEKIIRVTSCFKCPNWRETSKGSVCIAETVETPRDYNLFGIPDWCPLEDAYDVGKEE